MERALKVLSKQFSIAWIVYKTPVTLVISEKGDIMKRYLFLPRSNGLISGQVTVNGLMGSRQQPYVIRGYEDERPIWDGSVPIHPQKWDFDETTKICSAQLDQDTIIFALLLDDQLLTPARWPNALWEDKTVFNNRSPIMSSWNL